MKKFIYLSDGVNIVIPAPKDRVEKVLGPLTDTEYEDHVRSVSLPEGVVYRYVDDHDIPSSREFRNAWCDVTQESRIDIDLTKAKDIQLSKMRAERQKKFEELGFPYKLDSQLEEAIISKDTRDKLQSLRDATEPLKALEVSGYNDNAVLDQIKELGAFNGE
jgi:hypothetical protein